MTHPISAALLSCSGLELTDAEKRLFSKINPIGICLFGRNIQSADQVSRLCRQIKESIGREDVLIAIDQEGGRVRRLVGDTFAETAPQITIGNLPSEQAETAAQLHAKLTSLDLLKCGINLNLAPVLDRLYPQTTEALKSRCLSSNELVISRLGKIMINEYISNHICPCIKHMPGHGRAAVDPHLNLPVVTASLKDLEQDFAPFRENANAPAGLTAHIIIKEVDNEHPVTQSAKAIKEIIRTQIGFNGFLFSDAIEMHALKGSLEEKALQSLQAGCDAIVYAMGHYDELERLGNICPSLSEEALQRFETIKKIILQPRQTTETPSSALRQYRELVGSVAPYQETYDATEVLNILQQPRR